ncbi:MAG: prepilin-type N-terminal cleavage/methylation domain-containing protein [Planctomycetota bacterium]|jgi:prepilin-type N-terminal cleavage/methylation domain-containing protein
MKTRKYKNGLTLIEMLVVVGIIAILATMVIGIAAHIDTQAKERGFENILALLEGALQEYHEFTGDFPVQLEKDFVNAAAHSEHLYKELSLIPNSRKILEKIIDSLIENKYGAAGTTPEIYDPWGMVLDYRYDPATDNFPELVSAGPDRIFSTADDINNRK